MMLTSAHRSRGGSPMLVARIGTDDVEPREVVAPMSEARRI